MTFPFEMALYLIQKYEPDFIRQVNAALAGDGSITLTLQGYENLQEVVWACLSYAMDKGVPVTLYPAVLKVPMPHREP